MLFRWLALFMIALQVLLFLSGCEQIKAYRMKAYYEKAQNLYEEQDYRAALKEVQFALEFNPDSSEALALQGMCQYELKNYADAAWSLESALLVDASRDDLALVAAESFYRVGRFYKAVNRTGLLLEKDPANAAARYLDARIRLRSRMLYFWSGVDTILEPLFSAEEYKNESFALLAEFHILNDDTGQAEAILNEHAHQNEDWIFAMRMLAAKHESQGDLEAAARIYGRVLELKPDSMADADALLDILRSAKQRDAELQLLESLMAADEQQVRYKLRLIEYYIYCGQFEEAEQHILSARKQDEGYVEFSRYLIDVYEKTNRYAEAVAVAKDVLGRVGDDAILQVEFMNILARLYYLQDNPALAKIVVRWVLGLDRNSHAARFLLSRIALDEGRTLLAIAELRGLGSEDTENPEYDYYIALAHMARAEYNIAEQSFKEALKKKPSYKQALLKLTELYFEKGYFLDVERMVNEFLAVSPGDPDMLALQAQLAKRTVSVPVSD